MHRDWNGLLITVEGAVHAWLVRHSIDLLRVSMGLVFLGFGVLKFFPGVSPAESIVEATIHAMSGGLVPDRLGVVVTAVLECLIGLSLLTGRFMRLMVYLLAAELLGILSPVVLLPGRLFAGPAHMPTLEGQYVLKDLVLVAAAMVVTTQFRGAHIVLDETWVPAAVQAAADHPVVALHHGVGDGDEYRSAASGRSPSRLSAGRRPGPGVVHAPLSGLVSCVPTRPLVRLPCAGVVLPRWRTPTTRGRLKSWRSRSPS